MSPAVRLLQCINAYSSEGREVSAARRFEIVVTLTLSGWTIMISLTTSSLLVIGQHRSLRIVWSPWYAMLKPSRESSNGSMMIQNMSEEDNTSNGGRLG